MTQPRICVLASGGGRSLENLCERIAKGELKAEIALVISDRASAGALERAKKLGLPHQVIPHSDFKSPQAYAAAVFAAMQAAGCKLAVLAGFLRLLLPPADWAGRVINIHPSLLPKFGGKGFYGERVHRAVIEAGETESGCTVHFVDQQYDHGDHILQRRIPVLPGEYADGLAARVFEEEKQALPEAIGRVLAGLGGR